MILPALACYLGRNLCAMLGSTSIGLMVLMSLLLLLTSGRPAQVLKTLEQRVAAAAGLLGLSYVACDLFWHFYGDLLRSRWIAVLFYVIWRILGGMSLALLVCVLAPRNIKALLRVLLLLLIAFNVVVIYGYSVGHLAAALIFPSLGIGLLVAMSIHCGILFRLEKAERDGLVRTTGTGTVAAARGK